MDFVEALMGNKFFLIAGVILIALIFVKTLHILLRLSFFALLAIIIIIWFRTL